MTKKYKKKTKIKKKHVPIQYFQQHPQEEVK